MDVALVQESRLAGQTFAHDPNAKAAPPRRRQPRRRYALKPQVKPLIQGGIAIGVRFTFVVPATEEATDSTHILSRLTGGKENVTIASIDHDVFRTSAVTDYLIADPDSNSMQMFLELPLAHRGYWIDVDDQAAQGFVARFKKLIETQVLRT